MKHRLAIISDQFAQSSNKTHCKVIGSYVNLNGFDYKIIGEFKANKLINIFQDTTDIYVPKNSYSQTNPLNKGKGLLITLSKNFNNHAILKKIVRELKTKGSTRYRGSYHLQDNQQAASAVGNALKGITTFISAVAGISLFIAGIGVMNMTYISVAERMEEIGIRRAIGAKSKDITMQFLIEGTMLSTFGGIIGYILGFFLQLLSDTSYHFRLTLNQVPFGYPFSFHSQ